MASARLSIPPSALRTVPYAHPPCLSSAHQDRRLHRSLTPSNYSTGNDQNHVIAYVCPFRLSLESPSLTSEVGVNIILNYTNLVQGTCKNLYLARPPALEEATRPNLARTLLGLITFAPSLLSRSCWGRSGSGIQAGGALRGLGSHRHVAADLGHGVTRRFVSDLE